MRLPANLFLYIFASTLFLLGFAQATPQCIDLFKPTNQEPEVAKIVFPAQSHYGHTLGLRNTLSGNLATVFRSEWKTKLPVLRSNEFVFNLINLTLTPTTRAKVLGGLDFHMDGFVREVHKRLWSLQSKDLLDKNDDLNIRNAPPPPGAEDTTFTFYTKPIVSDKSQTKHQIRVRSYLRKIIFAEIPFGQSVVAFTGDGKQVEFKRSNDGRHYSVVTDGVTEIFDAKKINTKFGNSIQMYAPHGQKFKLEVKTALDDQILGKNGLPQLAGPHMVQKLDVSLTPNQVEFLFAPFNPRSTPVDVKLESLRRIYKIISDLSQKNPDTKDRLNAEFKIVIDAIIKDPYFLTIIGATYYNRTPFESKTGVQITIDRDQAVFFGNMYDDTTNSLYSPMQAIQGNPPLNPNKMDARHVEFKTPVTSMDNTAGISFVSATGLTNDPSAENNSKILGLMKLYHNYVTSIEHKGKFNYLIKNGEGGISNPE